MKFFYIILFILAGVGLADTVQEQLSGQVEVSMRSSTYVADRRAQPEEYQRLMNYQWARAGILGLAGLGALYLTRRKERLDPFSPSFQGNASVDELGAHLDRQTSKKPESGPP